MVDQVGRQGLEQYLYAFGAFLAGGRGPERFDLASILRVPGTVNYPDARKRKQGRQASPTEVCDCIESRFGLTDFDDLLARFPHQAPAAPAPGNGSVEIGTIPSDWHEVLSKDAQLQDLWDGKGKTQGDTSPSGYSMALARRLVEENGYSGAEMLAIMQAHYQHMGQPPKSPSSLQTTLGKAKVSPGKNSEHPNPWSRARSVREFVNSGTPTVAWLHPLLLAKGYLTQMFSPRGIGKTLVAHLIARKLVAEGRRVLLLDRDNPEGEVRRRLVSVGAGAADGLKVMTRHEVPSLTDQQAWKSFPAAEYDAIIVDSLDSSAEGVGEKDSAKKGDCSGQQPFNAPDLDCLPINQRVG